MVFTCAICDKVMNLVGEYRRHIRETHDPEFQEDPEVIIFESFEGKR